jgi:uncharacterized protein (TIGR03437 family)
LISVKRVFTAITVVLLGACSQEALVAQAIAPRKFRAVAGESRTGALRDGIPSMTVVTSARTTPPLEFPIRVQTTAAPEPSGLKLVIPPATPPGDYTVEITGRGPDGQSMSTALQVTVDAVTLSPAAVVARPPVILLNGFQLVCGNIASTLAASVDTFGQLAFLLQADGVGVAYFNNCTYGDISIEQLAGQLNNYISTLRYTDGTPINQVDLVVHSMGGLIARAYLAGKGQASGSFSPPPNPKVRKLIAIATPHFGSFQAGYIGAQESEMAPGNQFLWDLATWNQGQDDLRGVDALAIIGNAGTFGTTASASDGVVSLTSGSLGFVQPDQRTRIVPYCHITPGFLTGLGMSCINHQGIADIDSASHLSAQIVRSFLADTSAWQSVGYQPSADPFLRSYGGALLALKGTNDVYFTDLTAVAFDNAAGSLVAGPNKAIASLFYSEFIAGGQHSFSMTHSNGQVTTGTGTPVAGSPRALLFKFGPVITGVRSAAGGLAGLTVASGSSITVFGGGFSGTGTQLTANGAPLTISSSSDQQITAFLPGGYNGLVQLKVTNASGQHMVNIMAAAAAPPPSISLSTGQASFSFTLGGSVPASQPVTITNAGGGTLAWSAASNSAWLTVSPNSGVGSGTFTLGLNPAGLAAQTYNGAITVTASGAVNSPQTISLVLTVNAAPVSPVVVSAVVNAASWTGGTVAPGELVVIGGLMLGPSAGVTAAVDPSTSKMASQVAGTRVLFDGIAAPLLYTSARQVNAIVPYETAGCTQTVLQVEYQGVRSMGTAVPCGSASPGIFTFNASGAGPAAAANQDGTFNGPSSPAAKGSYVTLYFTGGGQTNPAGVTGSITGTSTLKWLTQGASVTVGGVAATVAFDGAAPTFVDGVLQLNIQLSGNTPSGSALPVVIKVGNASSPATATLAVQ